MRRRLRTSQTKNLSSSFLKLLFWTGAVASVYSTKIMKWIDIITYHKDTQGMFSILSKIILRREVVCIFESTRHRYKIRIFWPNDQYWNYCCKSQELGGSLQTLPPHKQIYQSHTSCMRVSHWTCKYFDKKNRINCWKTF